MRRRIREGKGCWQESNVAHVNIQHWVTIAFLEISLNGTGNCRERYKSIYVHTHEVIRVVLLPAA
jgi:hypothetical protein